MNPDADRGALSPFFKRVHGAYTGNQAEYIFDLCGQSPKTILDPMAGGGWYLPKLVAMGHRLTALDVNPVAVALISLRDPRLLDRLERIGAHLERVLTECPGIAPHVRSVYEEGWLPESLAAWLHGYSMAIRRVERLGKRPLEEAPVSRVLSYLPLLVARRFATFSQSDNVTWVKPGGLNKSEDPRQLLRTAFAQWRRYIESEYQPSKCGSLVAKAADLSVVRTRERFGVVVFSPPYANRLDYLRLWAPEASTYRAVVGHEPFLRARDVIGTTIVRGISIDRSMLVTLPTPVQHALKAIKEDTAKASASYYYPFFANYAIRLHSAIRRAGGLLARGGVGAVFVRDTPRKDTLFPAWLVAEDALRKSGCVVTDKIPHIIRGHIGMRRRRDHSSLQGLAQREWWLRFERPR